MKYRRLGRTGHYVSVIGLGTWQLGADWGHVPTTEKNSILAAAIAGGVRLIDTADVYGDGRSERIIGEFTSRLAPQDPPVVVATKMGKRGPQELRHFNLENMRRWAHDSVQNLRTDQIDLVQLHCPPESVLHADEVFETLDLLVADGLIASYGVSVETCQQAMAAMARPSVGSIQIVLNMFRRKPLDEVLPAAVSNDVGVIARVPLASGLLSASFSEDTTFSADDHRHYNRHGAAFDIGETFSGVDFKIGLQAAGELARLAPDGMTAAQMALAWVIQQPGVSSVIPGATRASQAASNAAVADLPELPDDVLDDIERIYDEYIRPAVHARW